MHLSLTHCSIDRFWSLELGSKSVEAVDPGGAASYNRLETDPNRRFHQILNRLEEEMQKKFFAPALALLGTTSLYAATLDTNQIDTRCHHRDLTAENQP